MHLSNYYMDSLPHKSFIQCCITLKKYHKHVNAKNIYGELLHGLTDACRRWQGFQSHFWSRQAVRGDLTGAEMDYNVNVWRSACDMGEHFMSRPLAFTASLQRLIRNGIANLPVGWRMKALKHTIIASLQILSMCISFSFSSVFYFLFFPRGDLFLLPPLRLITWCIPAFIRIRAT